MTVPGPVLALLWCLARTAAAQQSSSRIGDALVDQSVQTITVQEDSSLVDYGDVLHGLASGAPYTLQRSVTIQAGTSAGDGLGAGSQQPLLDLAYLTSLLQLAPGTTLTLKNLRVARSEVGCPLGAFANSPGATVVYDGSALQLEVCPPALFAQVVLLNAQRPIPGTNYGTFHDSVWYMSDVVVALPTVSNRLGGYTAHWRNGAMVECRSVVGMPSECQDLTPQDPAASPECMAAVQAAMRHALCQRAGGGTCINGCFWESCSKRPRYKNYARRH